MSRVLETQTHCLVKSQSLLCVPEAVLGRWGCRIKWGFQFHFYFSVARLYFL